MKVHGQPRSPDFAHGPLLPRSAEEDKNIWLMSYGVQRAFPRAALPWRTAGPNQHPGDFAIPTAISVPLEFKLCHSGQGEEEEVAGLGVRPAAVRRGGFGSRDGSAGFGISCRYGVYEVLSRAPPAPWGSPKGAGIKDGVKKPPFWASHPKFNKLKKTLMFNNRPQAQSEGPVGQWRFGRVAYRVRREDWEGVGWLGRQRVGYLGKQLLGWPTGWPVDPVLGRFC